MRIPTGRHSDFDLSIQSFDLFLLKLIVSLQVLHLKTKVWELRACSYCTKKKNN